MFILFHLIAEKLSVLVAAIDNPIVYQQYFDRNQVYIFITELYKLKKKTVILFLLFSIAFIGQIGAQIIEAKSPFIQEIAIRFMESNNFLLQAIMIFLVILIFGYSAKLFYESKYRKE